MIMGTGGAFASKISKNADAKVVNRWGYIFNLSTNVCDKVRMCSTEGSVICTVNNEEDGQQIFGTSGLEVDHPLTCDVTLQRIP